MNFILLVLTVILLSVDSIFAKEYNKKAGDRGAFLFSAMSAAAGCLFFLLSGGSKLSFDPAILPYAVLFAVAFATTIVCVYMAVLTGPLSFSSLATSYSLIIPTVYGLIFWGEESSIFFFLGIACLAVSLYLINRTKDEDKKVSLKWAMFAFLAFVGNGVCSTAQTAQQKAFDGLYKNELMVVALLLVTVILLCAALVADRKSIKSCIKQGTVLALSKGVANGIMNLLVMTLAVRMPASLMFPFISVGSVIASTIMAVAIYKERLSKIQIAGLVCGLLAVLFLNL